MFGNVKKTTSRIGRRKEIGLILSETTRILLPIKLQRCDLD